MPFPLLGRHLLTSVRAGRNAPLRALVLSSAGRRRPSECVSDHAREYHGKIALTRRPKHRQQLLRTPLAISPISVREFHSTATSQLQRDPYKVLGVAKAATLAEIKEAYYSLAKKYHPDANKTDKDAHTKFSEIREAYEILSNEERRKAFDATGYTGGDMGADYAGAGAGAGGFGPFAGRGFGFDNVEDIFSQFEDIIRDRGAGFEHASKRGGNIQMSLDISFVEAAKGAEKSVNYTTHCQCKTCKGSGAKAGTKPSTCSSCGGSGHETLRSGFFGFQRTCRSCGGAGTIILAKCGTCSGKGRVVEKRSIKVDIPPGVDSGTNLQFKDQGEAGEHGAPPGHLYITLNVHPSSIFKREGPNVYVEVPISFVDAILGGTVKVPTLEGQVEVSIPSGTQPQDKLIMRNKGMKKLNSDSHGHQFVIFKIQLPKHLTDNQKEILRTFAEEERGSGGGEHKGASHT